jgi:predicted DNA-binding protein (MmcQ/YjbR family)
LSQIRDQLRGFAVGFPGAYEEFPWGERVVKVAKKVFVFLGMDDESAGSGISVKLRESQEWALSLPGTKPTGYGLGRAGWVSIDLQGNDSPPLDLLTDWIEESYRLIAPKRLIAQLDARPSA